MLPDQIEHIPVGMKIDAYVAMRRPHQPVVVVLNETPILRADWNRQIVAGDMAVMIRLPQGGDGSNPVKLIATLALVVFAPYAAAGLMGAMGVAGFGGTFAAGMAAYGAGATLGFGGSLLAAGIVVGGSMLLNAVMPEKLPSAGSTESPSSTYDISAQSNRAKIGEVIPDQYGRLRRWPDLAAQPYMEYAGNEQYVYQMLCLGHGEYDVEKMMIGDTDVTGLEEVEYEIAGPNIPMVLFPDNVSTSADVGGQELNTQDSWVGPFAVCAAGQTTNKISIDLVCPMGLGRFDDEGDIRAVTVKFSVEVQEIDDAGNPLGDWTELNPSDGSGNPFKIQIGSMFQAIYIAINLPQVDREIKAATTTPQRKTFFWYLPEGRYQLRVKRVTSKSSDTKYLDDLRWYGLRAYLPSTVTYDGVTMLAVKIRTSGQIANQSIRDINCICTRKLPVWSGSQWSDPVATRSIAWALAQKCRATYGIELTDSRIDLDALLTLDATWSARGDYCDGVLDSKATIWDELAQIARCGRAQPILLGGNVTFKRDQAQTIIKGVFTPRNIVRGTFKIDYVLCDNDTPDDVVIEFFNNETWQWDDAQCSPTGDPSVHAARVKRPFISDRDHAYREGCYESVCNSDRRIFASFETEYEGRLLMRGDLISVSHDLPQWGYAGEVLAVDGRELSLSEPVVWESGSTHYVLLRNLDGTGYGPVSCSQGADSQTIVLSEDPPEWVYTGYQKEKTHYQFGPSSKWSQKMLVTSCVPRGFDRVEISAVNESDGVHTADTGTPPTVQTASLLPNVPDGPTIDSIYVSETWDQIDPQLNISWRPAPGAVEYIVQISQDGSDYVEAVTTTATSAMIKVNYGAVSIRVAAIGKVKGPWVTWSGTAGDMDFPPAQVTGLVLRESYDGDAYIQWDVAARATYYNVKVKESSTTKYEVDVKTNILDLPETLLTKYGGPWRSFDIEVTAKNSVGSAATTTLAAGNPAPAAPTVTVDGTTSSSISLSWNALSDSDLVGYHVYRGGVQKYEGTNTNYTENGLDPNTQYTYEVCGYDTYGDGTKTSKSATTDP